MQEQLHCSYIAHATSLAENSLAFEDHSRYMAEFEHQEVNENDGVVAVILYRTSTSMTNFR